MHKYKDTPETTKESIYIINPHLSEKPYLNFIRIDKLEAFDGMDGLIFFVSPYILSGLFTWANYDAKDIEAVKSPWGSGCSSAVTSLVNENRSGGKHCFIRMLDVSARPFFRPTQLFNSGIQICRDERYPVEVLRRRGSRMFEIKEEDK